MLAASSSVSRPSASPPKFYLIIFNIAKKANLGTLLRSACAFGVHEVLVVGQRKALQTFGNKGTVQHLSFREFDSLPLLGSWLKEHHIEVVGIEIIEGATSVSKHRFRGDTAFMLGNEGTGLSKKQIGFCDRFMYIPHAGNGTASLNVAVAGSIVLHHFSEWAEYDELERDGYKYRVTSRPAKSGADTPADQALKEKRRAKQERVDDVFLGGTLLDEEAEN